MPQASSKKIERPEPGERVEFLSVEPYLKVQIGHTRTEIEADGTKTLTAPEVVEFREGIYRPDGHPDPDKITRKLIAAIENTKELRGSVTVRYLDRELAEEKERRKKEVENSPEFQEQQAEIEKLKKQLEEATGKAESQKKSAKKKSPKTQSAKK